MSLYIPGVKMPERCWDCPLCYDMMSCRITGLNWYRDTVDFSIDPVDERMPNCPLIEVPEHGRLGDLDALKRYVEGFRTDDDYITDYTRKEIINCFVYGIGEAETIIPADKEEP